MRAKKTKMVVLALVLAGSGATVFKVCRAIANEHETFVPPRGAVTKPTDVVGLHDVAFAAKSGSTIRGWYAPSKNGAAVVLAHGAIGTRADVLPEARHLALRGYGVLLFDFHGHGESDGEVSWGEPDRGALRAAVDFVAAQPDVDASRIGAFGFSMGGCTLAYVAAADTRVAAVVLAGVFTSRDAQILVEHGSWGPITQVPARWEAKRGGMRLEELRPADVVPALAPRPVLFVSGSDDRTVPAWMVTQLHDVAREPKELWVIPGAGHGRYAAVAGAGIDYLARLEAFFAKNLPKRELTR